MNIMELPAELRPATESTVYALVKSAGLDVSDWSNWAGGVENPAGNPRYCYEWSFVEPGKRVLLTLWTPKMQQAPDGTVTYEIDFPGDQIKETDGNRRKRRERLAQAIDLAVAQDLPILVIVVNPKPLSSSGKQTGNFRTLDPAQWSVLSKDREGRVRLIRGVGRPKFADQYSLDVGNPGAPVSRVVESRVYERSAEVRNSALLRADGRCEYCGEPGFELPDGRLYLETHHVVPLSEGGSDHVSNVAALCPGHHREAHYGAKAAAIRERLAQLNSGSPPPSVA